MTASRAGARGWPGPAAGDYRPSDFALAVGTALLVLAGSVVALRASGGKGASGPGSELLEVPVRIVGLSDPTAPLLKLGGGPGKAKGRARPAGKVGAPAKGASPRDVAAGEEPAAAPPDPGAEATSEPGEAAEPEPGAGAAVDPGRSADAGEGGSGLGGPPGEGHPEGVPGGTETDPLKARAADVYRARLIAWFSSRFRVSGSGLSQPDLVRLRAPATVNVSADRRVLGYSLAPSGNAVFDAAARLALEGTVGATLPPPPENYPDLAHSQISVTFVCTEGRCD